MKILFTLPYVPVPATFGGAMRVFHLMKLVSQRHDVSIITYGWPEEEFNLRDQLGSQVKSIHVVSRHWPRKLRRIAQLYSLFGKHSFFYMLARSKEMQTRIDQVLSHNDFDIVQTEFAHMASFDLKTNGVKILDSHNVEYDNFRRMWLNSNSPLRRLHYRSEYKKFYREELDACTNYDALFVTSARDKAILDADIPSISKYIVPNGVDAKYFTPSLETPEPYSIVFTGAMSYVPNYDGMTYFLDNIFPLILKKIPEARVYIVGSRPPKHLTQRASTNVIVTGFVDDVRPYVWRSSVYIVPLRMGSGTRLKVLEAMAMRKPIVTTSIGCEGIDVVNGESALIADEPHSFAESVVKILHDNALRQKLIRNGYDLMRSRYEWSVIGDVLEELYQSLSQKSKGNNIRATRGIEN
ncbi:MAG: glycosyltransferase [Ignavibacteria bacterium]|nr:glycosyltransferase [Ignavibacteria bacterium]